MSDQNNQKTRILREIDKEWDCLMKLAHRIDFGRVEVILQNGKPIRAELIVKQIKLDVDKEFEEGLKTIPLL